MASGLAFGARRVRSARRTAATLALVISSGLVVLAVSAQGDAGGARAVIEIIIAVGLVALAAQRPVYAFVAVFVYLPVQTVLLAALLSAGMPANIVRGLGSGKEFLTVVAITVAIRSRVAGRRFDALDWLAGALVLIATLYLVIPFATGSLVGSQPLEVRALAWRIEVLFILLFIAVRRITFTARDVRLIVTALFITEIGMAAFAAYEWLAPQSYNTFLVSTVQVPEYFARILSSPLPNPTQLLSYSTLGAAHPRSGSLILSPINYCWYALIGFAVSLEMLLHDRVRVLPSVVALATAVGILLSGTRSALIAALVVAAVTLLLGGARRVRGRARLVLLMLVTAVVLTPAVASSGLVHRIEASASGSDTSTNEHVSRLQIGYDDVLRAPAGRGLGADPSVGARFQTDIVADPENSYLQVAIELGIAAAVLFLAFLVTIMVRTSKSARRGRRVTTGLAAAVSAGAAGFLIGGLFLQVWTSFATSMCFFSLAAIATTRAPLTAQGETSNVQPKSRASQHRAVTPPLATARLG